MKVLHFFTTAFTLVALLTLAVRDLPIPFFDPNGTTLICDSQESQAAVTEAIATATGRPVGTLNTVRVLRFLFKEGTSVDALDGRPEFEWYKVIALKSIVLGLFSQEEPTDIAQAIVDSLRANDFRAEIITQPDSEIPDGSTVLVLSDAFRTGDTGFGIIVRRNGLRIGGPVPKPLKYWPPIGRMTYW
ncbi:MAG: hypothetical protein WC817_02310 [Patescibacteria group bacterium]|jgi:hypothetical protein